MLQASLKRSTSSSKRFTHLNLGTNDRENVLVHPCKYLHFGTCLHQNTKEYHPIEAILELEKQDLDFGPEERSNLV
jgi:hypothetical protein